MECEELKRYLKDVYELEKQLYSLRQIEKLYVNELDSVNEECNTLYLYEPLFGEAPIIDWDGSQKENQTILPPEKLLDLDNIFLSILFPQAYPYERWDLANYQKELEDKNVKRSFFKKTFDTAVYNNGTMLFNSIVDYYTNHYNNDIEKKRTILQPFCDKIQKEYSEQILVTISNSEKLLTQLYAQDIIHPKYRNFLAIAQIYEYFDTGRCIELVGANGAYNLYEQELRQNTIIDRLDVIVSQLQMLNRTMAYVASAISESNSILRNISSTLRSIDANTALTAYNSQCIAYNTNIANRYHY